MELIIIIAIIAAVYFLVIKPKQQNANTSRSGGATPTSTQVTSQQRTINQPTRGVNLVPADALINSPYYKKYKIPSCTVLLDNPCIYAVCRVSIERN